MKIFQRVINNILLILVGMCLGRLTTDYTCQEQKTRTHEEIKLSNTEIEFVSDEVYHQNQAYINSLSADAEITR